MAKARDGPNWKKIKTDYLAGKRLKDIAKKHGVSVSAINSRRTRERWVSDKSDIASKTRQKCIEKIADEQATIIAQMAVLHDRAGLAAFKKLLKQFEDFPENGAATKVVRESVKVQEVDTEESKIKIPLKTQIESNMSETVKNLATMSKLFGFDAASKMKLHEATDEAEIEDDGFMDALKAECVEAWNIEDKPENVQDSE